MKNYIISNSLRDKEISLLNCQSFSNIQDDNVFDEDSYVNPTLNEEKYPIEFSNVSTGYTLYFLSTSTTYEVKYNDKILTSKTNVDNAYFLFSYYDSIDFSTQKLLYQEKFFIKDLLSIILQIIYFQLSVIPS
jgi:hypothetical protein